MKKLEFENIIYEWNEEDEYKEHKFASLKKITIYKGNKKYQSVTVKHEHLNRFKDFLKDIVGEEKEDEPF